MRTGASGSVGPSLSLGYSCKIYSRRLTRQQSIGDNVQESICNYTVQTMYMSNVGKLGNVIEVTSLTG